MLFAVVVIALDPLLCIFLGLGTKQKFEKATDNEENDENMLKIADAKRIQEIEIARQKVLLDEMAKEEK